MHPSLHTLVRHPLCHRRGLATVAAALSSGLALALAGPFVGTATASTWGRATEITPPANAASNPQAAPDSIACTATGACVAVGNYKDGSKDTHLMVATETGGSWGQAVEITPPANAGSGELGSLRSLLSISCPAPGACVAVGNYWDSSNSTHAMAATETGGSWGQAVEISPPANAKTTAQSFAGVWSVSCTAPGACVAVGDYEDNSGNHRAMVATETGGSWGQAVEMSPPANAGATEAFAQLLSVSCTATGSCIAIGRYADSSGNGEPMAVAETGGSWGQASEITLPANAASNPAAFLGSIACSASGSCAAVGSYADSSGNGEPMAVAETGGMWGQAVEVALPAISPATAKSFAGLDSVSCPEAGSCVAVGTYEESLGNNHQPIVAREAAGAWSQAGQVTPPANAASPPRASLYSIACVALGSCVAVGNYKDVSGNYQAMAVNEEPESPSSGGSPGGGGTTTTTTTTATTSTPPPTSGTVTLASTNVTTQGNGTASVKLACTGTGTCSGKLTITVTGTTGKKKKTRKGKKKRSTTMMIGTGSFTIAPGKTATVAVKLDAAGRALLKAHHGHLNATLTIRESSSVSTSTKHETIHLVQKKPRHHSKKHHSKKRRK